MSEEEIHVDSGDERTLPQDAAPHSESDYRPRKWISDIEWTKYIQEHDVPFGPSPAVSPSIFTVPQSPKDTKREAYVPRRVSLGPYHHGGAELRSMDHHKGKALRTMMERFNAKKNPPVDLNHMDFANPPVDLNHMDFAQRAMEEILKLENQIRGSYEENIYCNGETLARVLILDGCFLLEVLRSLGENGLAGDVVWEKKIIFSASNPVNDILMLENQVPFIVLLNLLKLELDTQVGVEEMLLSLLMKTTWGLFKHFDNRIFDTGKWLAWLGPVKQEPVPVEQFPVPVEQFHHLLGFLYRVIVSPPIFLPRHRLDGGECSDYIQKTGNDVQRIRPAVELRNAGIRFKPCEGGIKGIYFDENSATIFLPPIRVTDITEVLFHNLIAFEMCQPLETKYVSYYVNLMDNLIYSEQDVALLIRMGVLGNWVGRDKEVVDLFMGLRKAAPVNLLDAFCQLTKRVNDHYEHQIRVQLQFPELVRDYFSPPWRAVASGAAILLLFNALLQTIFTAMQTFK